MSASVPYRVRVLGLLVTSTAVLAGCGHAAPSVSPGTASAVNCPSGAVPGLIGGQPKCLESDQQCQQRWASDYSKYGFECRKNNGKFELTTKSR
jgi:hypothetical protein